MRVGVATAFACGVGIYKRLQDEGCSVRVWRGSVKTGSPALLTSHRRVGEGIVPLTNSWADLLAWCVDGMRREPTVLLFDSSGLGELADEARRKGVHVVGGGTFCDRLEKDRAFGRDVATEAGTASGPYKEFATVDDCLAYARDGGVTKPVYWKTDTYLDGDSTHKCEDAESLIRYLTWVKTRASASMSCILEEKLDGIALSTARWWNGRAWVGPYEWTLERKAHMPGNVGPSTGCSINAVGMYADDEPVAARALNWNALTPIFTRHEAPPGLYDINAIANDGTASFLEFTPRFGWDSEPTAQLLFPVYAAWLWQVATGTGDYEPVRDEFAVSVRLTIPPAPWEHGTRDEKGSAVGVYVAGDTGDLWNAPFIGYQLMQTPDGLAMAAPEALVGLSAAVGDTASVLARECMEFPKESLDVPGLQYWATSVDSALVDDAQACADEGFDDIQSGARE